MSSIASTLARSGASPNKSARVSVAFFTLDEVLAIHSDQIERYGGSFGIRDSSLLESALAMPDATFSGEDLHPSLFEKAAAYVFHLVKNHPFVDGNKRAGLAVGLAFLALNDVLITATDEELVLLILDVAEGKRSKADVAVFLRSHRRK
jgi:death on curing protein